MMTEGHKALAIRILVSIVCVLALGAVAFALPHTPGPRVSVSHEVFDFGLAPQHSELSHVFWLHNTGDAELVVDKLITNCGCSQAPIDKKDVQPGDSTRVEFIFGSSTYDGEVTKFAQIMSNAVGRVPALSFLVDVVPDSAPTGPLEFTPRTINLDERRPEQAGAGWTQTVILKNTSASVLKVAMIDRPDRYVHVEPFETTLAPGDTRRVALQFDSGLPENIFSTSLTVELSGAQEGRLTLPIFKKHSWNADDRSSAQEAQKGS